MTVTAEYAAEHFQELTSALDRGERVEIERPGKARLQLLRVKETTPVSDLPNRALGTGVGKLRYVPDHEQWQAMDRDLWGELLDGADRSL